MRSSREESELEADTSYQSENGKITKTMNRRRNLGVLTSSSESDTSIDRRSSRSITRDSTTESDTGVDGRERRRPAPDITRDSSTDSNDRRRGNRNDTHQRNRQKDEDALKNMKILEAWKLTFNGVEKDSPAEFLEKLNDCR